MLCLSGIAKGQQWSGVLSSSRATDWSQAGIPGGIPSGSWTQCGPTIAPYGSSGAYASPGTIVNAINHTGSGYTSCGSNTYVLLGAGDFYLSSGIRNVGVNNTELRGSGPTQTRLHFSNGATCQGGNGSCLIGFESSDNTYPAGVSSAYNWTSGYSKGSTTITLSSGANITANRTVLVLDQCDTGYSGSSCSGTAVDNKSYFNCEDAYNTSNSTGCSFNSSNGRAARTHRFQTEMVEVTSCSPSCGNSGSTTVTITPALQHPNWSSGQTPQAYLIQPSKYVGITNLLIDGSATSASNATAGPSFYNTAYYWLKNVVVKEMGSIGAYTLQTIHGNVESNYFYGIGKNDSNADPSGINYTGSNNLYVNNIFQNSKIGPLGNGPNNGNVIAYNYIANAWTGDGFLFGSLWDGHSNGADYNLFEGNVLSQALQDQTHGTHLMETWYRNFFTGWESCANGQCGSDTFKSSDVVAFEALSYNRYNNLVANVLGTPGVTTAGYQVSQSMYTTYSGTGKGHAYNIGSGNSNGPPSVQGGPIPLDSVVGTSMLRWGNWDAFNGSTRWNTSEVPSGISAYPNSVPTSCTSGGSCPPSFYLSSRPSWWSSSIPFPAIGPDVSNGNVGQCTGTLNTPGQFAGVAATSSGQCRGTSLASAWGGHINAIPAMACFLNVMGGPPDGTGGILSFDANKCYTGSTGTGTQTPPAPSNLNGVVIQ